MPLKERIATLQTELREAKAELTEQMAPQVIEFFNKLNPNGQKYFMLQPLEDQKRIVEEYIPSQGEEAMILQMNKLGGG